MKFSILSAIGFFIFLTLHQCRVSESSQVSGHYEWDMSVENHSGKSKNRYTQDGKHRGMSVFNWRNYNDEDINQLVKNNIECVALVPFMFQETDHTKVLHQQEKVGSWDRGDSIYIQVINDIHSRGMHVMLKPHIWMNEGWRSTIHMDNDDEWNTWFESYRKHMIHYAMLAEQTKVKLYCIGTELRSSIKAQPEKWDSLIAEIKTIYSGKLTYAANWDDNSEDILFWDRMDYIGIQAYYPLTDTKNPSLSDIEKGWQRHISKLTTLSEQHKKPILFTETGYRSDETATIKPWEWGSAQDTARYTPSNRTQQLAYEALFRQLWHKEWFAGTYFWQWHNVHSDEYKINNMDFTPRYKPAENVMAKWYGE